MIAGGKLGRIASVSAYVHQNWKAMTVGQWRQDPEISGGGFLFDTGSHMVNTVVDLIDQDVVEVCALMGDRGTPVDINSTVSGRFRDGTLLSRRRPATPSTAPPKSPSSATGGSCGPVSGESGCSSNR